MGLCESNNQYIPVYVWAHRNNNINRQAYGPISEFSFGLLYDDDSTSYESLLNDNDEWYGSASNSYIISVEFPGLGLPAQSFIKF